MLEPVQQYHRLEFDNAIIAVLWADKLSDVIVSPNGFRYMGAELRAVVWRSLPHGVAERPGYVFLSEGALRIARELNASLPLAGTTLATELPGGLSLLLGDQVDVEAYGRSRRGHGGSS